jgi:hypothetical protein
MVHPETTYGLPEFITTGFLQCSITSPLNTASAYRRIKIDVPCHFFSRSNDSLETVQKGFRNALEMLHRGNHLPKAITPDFLQCPTSPLNIVSACRRIKIDVQCRSSPATETR